MNSSPVFVSHRIFLEAVNDVSCPVLTGSTTWSGGGGGGMPIKPNLPSPTHGEKTFN